MTLIASSVAQKKAQGLAHATFGLSSPRNEAHKLLGGGGGPKLGISGGPKQDIGFGKRGLLEKGSSQKSPFSRDSREFRESRVSRETPDCGKVRSFRPFSRDSRESRDLRDSRDFSSEKTPFVMTPFSGPEVTLSSPIVTCR